MRRFEFSATHRDVIEQTPANVLGLLGDVRGALALFPSVGAVHEIEPSSRYAIALGPFGVGGFRGTVRAEVRVARPSSRVVLVESVPGTGNTDLRVRVEVEASDSSVGSTSVQIAIWASPRKAVPALLPLSLVQSVARRTVERALELAIDEAKNRLAASAPLPGAPAAA